MLRPSVLLLDEPLGALDAKLRRTLQVELGALQKQVGITFLYVTHDQEEALTMSDRLAVMNHGTDRPARHAGGGLQRARRCLRGRLPRRLEPDGRPGRAGRRRAGSCRLRLGDFTLEAEAGQLDATGAVKLAIRPERIHLHPYETAGANRVPGMVERLVFLGSTTHVYVRLATGSALQTLVRNDGAALPYSQGTPVSVGLPADALRVLPDPGVSVAEIHDETTGDQVLDLTGTSTTVSDA